MGKYIHYFRLKTNFEAEYYGDQYLEPWVSLTEENNKVNYNKTQDDLLLETPLTFDITEGGNIMWKSENSSITKVIEYRKNDGEWTSITSTTEGVSISVISGDTLQFRGDNDTYCTTSNVNCGFSGSTAQFEAKGNIMSLINSTNFATTDTLETPYTFSALFGYCTGLTEAEDLLLPATTLINNCYRSIFYNCTGLRTAPELPATTLADLCYRTMFYNCTSLTKAPALPATTLAASCYTSMFSNCTSLTEAPTLPAAALSQYCYASMFSNCTSLTKAPELPATTMKNDCYSGMFSACTSLTEAPELPATTMASYCYSNMFAGCTSLTKAPELPAITMEYYCYNCMFDGCTSLTTAPELPATTLAQSCYNGMFADCTSLTEAPELPATAITSGCYMSMFARCTALTTAPELPASFIPFDGYRQMFMDCTNLNYIKCLATTIGSQGTMNWVKGVQNVSGTFVKDSSMTWGGGNAGVPSNWTIQDA